MTDSRLTDTEVGRYVAEMQRLQQDLDPVLDVAKARSRVAAIPRGPDDEHVRTEDITIPAPGYDAPLRGRIYTPTAFSRGVTLFFHGGGWVFGDLDTNDAMCRILAHLSGSLVVSVDYRLAPEHPHPAAVEDALAALVWVAEGAAGRFAPGTPVAVAGHSAGGNLAAVLAQLSANGTAPAVVRQVLLCPVLDHDLERESYFVNGEGLLLTRAEMAWYWDLYVPDPTRRSDPTCSPLRRTDLTSLPAATLVIADGDPLRDEAVEYGRRLLEAGTDTGTLLVPGVPHLFLTFPPMRARDEALQFASDRLREAFAAGDAGRTVS